MIIPDTVPIYMVPGREAEYIEHGDVVQEKQ